MSQPNNYNPSFSPNVNMNQPMHNNQQQHQHQQQPMTNQQCNMNAKPAPVYNSTPHLFPFHPMVVPCGNCGFNGQTHYEETLSAVGILVMILIGVLLFPISLFMFCCCWGCLTNPFKQGVHTCQKCGCRIGTTK